MIDERTGAMKEVMGRDPEPKAVMEAQVGKEAEIGVSISLGCEQTLFLGVEEKQDQCCQCPLSFCFLWSTSAC